MRLLIIIFIFFLGVSQNLSAQQIEDYGSLDTIRIQLKYELNADVKQIEVNNSLRSIAYTHQKPIETMQINWELISSYEVVRQERGGFKSEVLIKPLAPVGDLNVYNFNSSQYILPELQSFRLCIYSPDSTLMYLKYFKQNAVSVNSAGEISRFSILHQKWGKGYYMKIDQFELNSNSTDYSFEQWFQYINDYKAADYLVSDFLKKYKELQPYPQEPGFFLIKSLRQANYLKELYQMPFYGATVGAKNDPDQLEQKMKMLVILLDINIDKYIGIVKTSGFSENTNVESLINSYLNEDENFLHLQQNYASMYKEMFRHLSQTSYPQNLSYKNNTIFNLFANGQADKEKQLILAFENSLSKKSIVHINSLMEQELFSEALFYIENLEGFVKQSAALELSDDFKQTKAMAAYGMYNSYMSVVEKAIAVKNINLAVQYLNKAGSVQENYPQQILTNGIVEKKKSQLVNICFNDYYQMLEQNKYAEVTAMRDTIRSLIIDFQLEELEGMRTKLDMLDNQVIIK